MKSKTHYTGPIVLPIVASLVLVGSLYLCYLGYESFSITLIKRTSFAPDSQTQGNPVPMPTFVEIQEQLVKKGYDIKVDGKICKGWNCPEHSETLAAWGKEIGNQYNREICGRMSGGNK